MCDDWGFRVLHQSEAPRSTATNVLFFGSEGFLVQQIYYLESSLWFLFLVKQDLYYKILTIKLVNQQKELQWRL